MRETWCGDQMAAGIDVSMPDSMKWGRFILGLIVFTFFIGIVGATWAWIYNRFAQRAAA
jgi:hypothetical protein